jgi:shikimate dehydrogenase
VTTKAFVIGHPISHSRSPLIHGTWLAEYGIDGSYEAIDVAPAALPAFFTRLRSGEFAGGNVTIPHKEAVFALCD